MARLIKRTSLPMEKLHEHLMLVGNRKMEETFIRVIDFSETFFEERDCLRTQEIPERKEGTGFRWISVYGLHNTTVIEEIGERFSLHQLTLKSILDTRQRPGLEDYERYMYLNMNLVRFNKEEDKVNSDQISIIVGNDYLLSFHEKPIDQFKSIRERLNVPNSRLRRSGTGYLLYSILDTILHSYMKAVEDIGDKVEELEEQLVKRATPIKYTRAINYTKEIHFLRKSITPVSEHVLNVDFLNSGILPESELHFFNDLRRHFSQVSETLEAYGEILSNCVTIDQSNVSLRMRNILQVIAALLVVQIILLALK